MKSIVLFYSRSGNTRRISQIIAAQTGADLLEIKTASEYPSEYDAVVSQGRKEIQEKYRPPLCPISMNWEQYEVVFLGTPNWFGTMVPPMTSFLWEWMPTDKVIIPFCTHGGGGAGHIAHDMADYCIGCHVLPLLSIYGDGGPQADQEVGQWLKRITKILELSDRTSLDP